MVNVYAKRICLLMYSNIFIPQHILVNKLTLATVINREILADSNFGRL